MVMMHGNFQDDGHVVKQAIIGTLVVNMFLHINLIRRHHQLLHLQHRGTILLN
jgi:hypothetical protein